MLIHLDGSAVTDATSGSATARRSRACIENLLLSHFEGNHVISLLPGDAALLRDASPAWSARARRGLDHIDENYAQIAGLRADVAWSLELGLGAELDGKAHEVSPGKRVIRAPLHAFDRLQAVCCATLLGENPTDADFFQQVDLLRRAERRWDGMEIVHDARGGGGSTLALEYERLAARGQILLAIADTDMRHPGGGVGGTLRELLAKARDCPDYQRARPTPTRTTEGLVPLHVYKEAFVALHGAEDKRLGVLDRLKRFLQSAPADVARYAHFKDGLRIYQIEQPRTEAERQYWADIARNVGRDRCIWPASQQCKKREECRCYVVDALGAGALSDVVQWMKTQSSKRSLASRFDLTGNTPLAELADEVIAWGIALPPVLT